MSDSLALLDPLKLSPQDCERLLAELESRARPAPAARPDQRRDPRLPIQAEAFLVCSADGGEPGGSRFAVRCRNISASGLSFLYGSELREGTPCEMVLVNRRGDGFRLTGRVVRCRRVSDGVHEVGLQFDEPMDICEVVGE